MPKELFYATEGVITFTSPLFPADVGSDWSARVKDIRITGGARDIESVPCFGTGINVNIVEKMPTIVETTVTTVKKNNFANCYVMCASPYADVTTGSMKSPWGKAPEIMNVSYRWHDSRSASGPGLRIEMASAYAVSNEMNVAADGALEETTTFKCAPQYYKVWFSPADSGATSVTSWYGETL